MKQWLRSLLATWAAVLTAAGFLTAALFLATTPAKAAGSLVQVTNFGNDPSNNLMYIYVPTNVRPDPPILMALHQCTGTGPGFYSSTAFASLANEYGFIVIYPDANRSGQCWDVSSSQALTRNGGSDPVGLMSMITYTEQHYGGNPNQVYITGASSGAMMTNVMLADYPDVFKAGVAFMGVPYYCFYTGTVDGWNSACADGQVSMTGQAWGNLVRNTADPGYSGPRPRMEVWHGTADTTLNYNNFGQEILQWTQRARRELHPDHHLHPAVGLDGDHVRRQRHHAPGRGDQHRRRGPRAPDRGRGHGSRRDRVHGPEQHHHDRQHGHGDQPRKPVRHGRHRRQCKSTRRTRRPGRRSATARGLPPACRSAPLRPDQRHANHRGHVLGHGDRR